MAEARVGDNILIDGVNYLIEPGSGLGRRDDSLPRLRLYEHRMVFDSVKKGRVEVSVDEVLRVLVSTWEEFQAGYCGKASREVRIIGMPIPVVAALLKEWRSRSPSGAGTPLTPDDVRRVFGDKP